MNFYIKTLGCKVNQYESQVMTENLIKNGFTKINTLNKPDIIIINSCTVTSESDRKTRQFVHKAKKENPQAVIILCGCVPQAAKKNENNFKYADIIIGNTNRNDLIFYINEFLKTKKQVIDIKEHKNHEKYEKLNINDFNERTRAFMKIQDGCNNFCSYCLIPFARGRERSKKLEDIIQEAQNLALAGFKEIVLTGINLSSYGKEFGINLCNVVEEISKIEKIKRIRLSSVEPEFLSNEIIARLANCKKLCNHFHLCLQSGCNQTLKRMNRHYTTDYYQNTVLNLRNFFTNCSITTDILVGFPGEGDEEFNETLNFIKKIKFSSAHVFPYSIRQGTKAALMQPQVLNETKRSRCKIISKEIQKSKNDFLKNQIGKTLNVLFETKENNTYTGFSENYIEIQVESSKDIKAEILPIKITCAQDNYCKGIIST